LARLNVECANPTLLRDCIPGQKWKCINEDGRWRKHKCKFHREVQNHLAEVNKYLNVHGKRNCACFTPDGVVYTKIKTEREFFKPKQKRFDRHRHRNRHRNKRSTAHDADEIFIEQLPTDFLELLRMDEVVGNLQTALLNQNQSLEHSTRNKRETKDYVTQTLDELTTLLGSIERKYANSSVDPVQCFVESMGSVNCSTNVYENEDAWKQSRIQIDMLIKLLKSKITDLKDIKKHLKEHRPSNMTIDDDFYENFSLSAEEIDEIKEVTKAPKKKLSTTTTTSEPERKMKLSEISYSTTAENLPTITTQKIKNKTKIMRKMTTEIIPTTVTESSSSFSFTSESNFEYSTFNEMSSIDDSTTDFLKTTTPKEMRETSFVTMDTSVFEATTNSTIIKPDDSERNIPAECYCEPEPNK
jgi:hypothetical protein